MEKCGTGRCRIDESLRLYIGKVVKFFEQMRLIVKTIFVSDARPVNTIGGGHL